MKKNISILVFLFSILVSGCATNSKMPLLGANEKPEPKNHLMIFTLEMINEYKPRYQPNGGLLSIKKIKDGNSSDVFYDIDEKAKYRLNNDENQPITHLIRLDLEPGKYEIHNLLTFANAFPFMGHFVLPILQPIEATAGKVSYLGNLKAKVRERKGNEFRAGGVIPLIDQAAIGSSGGTWDVTISNRHEADIKIFRKVFPGLNGIEIEKNIFSDFSRDAAQKWWENK